MSHAKNHAGGRTRHAAITARELVMMGLLVDSVYLHVKCDAPIPGVLSLAQNHVRPVLKIVHGNVLIQANAIYLALCLATNCLARSGARKCWIVDIHVQQSVERSVHRLHTARRVVQTQSEKLRSTIFSTPRSGKSTLTKILASFQIAAM